MSFRLLNFFFFPSHFDFWNFLSRFDLQIFPLDFIQTFGLINFIVFRCLDFFNPMLILLCALRPMSLQPLEFSFKVRPSDFRFYIISAFDSWKVWYFDLWAFLSYAKSTLYFSSYTTLAFDLSILRDFDNWIIRKMSFRSLDISYPCHFYLRKFRSRSLWPSDFSIVSYYAYGFWFFVLFIYILGLSVIGSFYPHVSREIFTSRPMSTFSNFLKKNKRAWIYLFQKKFRKMLRRKKLQNVKCKKIFYKTITPKRQGLFLLLIFYFEGNSTLQ